MASARSVAEMREVLRSSLVRCMKAGDMLLLRLKVRGGGGKGRGGARAQGGGGRTRRVKGGRFNDPENVYDTVIQCGGSGKGVCSVAHCADTAGKSPPNYRTIALQLDDDPRLPAGLLLLPPLLPAGP